MFSKCVSCNNNMIVVLLKSCSVCPLKSWFSLGCLLAGFFPHYFFQFIKRSKWSNVFFSQPSLKIDIQRSIFQQNPSVPNRWTNLLSCQSTSTPHGLSPYKFFSFLFFFPKLSTRITQTVGYVSCSLSCCFLSSLASQTWSPTLSYSRKHTLLLLSLSVCTRWIASGGCLNESLCRAQSYRPRQRYK